MDVDLWQHITEKTTVDVCQWAVRSWRMDVAWGCNGEVAVQSRCCGGACRTVVECEWEVCSRETHSGVPTLLVRMRASTTADDVSQDTVHGQSEEPELEQR